MKKIQNQIDFADLNISRWWTALQVDSVLASFNDDCLQLIFAKLGVIDAVHLGFTCRRMFYQLKAFKKRTKAVEIIKKFEKHKLFFLQNIDHNGRDANENAPFAVLSLSRLKNISLSAIAQKLGENFVNLGSLEVSFSPDDPLLSQLSSSLPHLTTLKLNLNCSPYYFRNCFWKSFAKLQHCTLRHLTLYMLQSDYDKLQPQLKLYNIPIFKQLTSFTFFAKERVPNIYQIIRRLIIDSPFGAHLMPGVGARFGLRPFKRKQIIAEIPFDAELLPYFTYLNLSIHKKRCAVAEDNRAAFPKAMASLYRALPFMHNLQKVELKIGEARDEPSNYPTLLNGLSSLAHLRELSIDCHRNFSYGFGARRWTSLPVLASVGVLSLVYRTRTHNDIVRQFHLSHCFPALRQLQCHFKQDMCYRCHYMSTISDNLLQTYQTCGRALAQGLLELPGQLKKEMQFTFDIGHHFNSLESLLVGSFKSGRT